jgi:DNA mismatch repair ATPase MutL
MKNSPKISPILEKIASNKGTTVKVQNLFFKIPNRRLFINIKKEMSEIIGVIHKLALSYGSIKFMLFRENKHILSMGDSDEIIEQIFNIKEHQTIHINSEKDNFFLKIVINQNPKEKKGKTLFFVNRRPVQDCGILSLIKKHIENQVGEKNLSFLLVFLTIEYERVNCNLVPDKSKIKIENLEEILHTINKFFHKPILIKKENQLYENSLEIQYLNGWFVYENKFIFANYNNKVYVIDQHAISERILFNQLIESKYESQLLLERMIIKLTVEENLLMDNKETKLREIKFLFHRIDSYLLVYGIPEFLEYKDIENVIQIFIHENDEHLSLHKISEFACKNSLKGGTKINEKEILKFFSYLENDSRCSFCNHGRNTTFVINKNQIHKWLNIS